MRNFSFSGAFLSCAAVLALVGCPAPAPRLIDAAMVDASMPGMDTNVMLADSPGTDTNGLGPDMGSGGGMCARVGGGCDLFAHACPPMGATRQGCYLDLTAPPDAGGSDAGAGTAITACRAAGSAQSGQPCPTGAECDDGLICLSIGGGTCSHACCGNTDCAAGETCNPLGNNPPGVTTGYCERPVVCTPVPNAGCAAMQQCIITHADGTTGCTGSGTVAEGASCNGGDCVTGTGCYGTATAHNCTRLCRIAMGNTDCTGPTAHTCMMNGGLGTTYGLCM